MGHNQRHQRYEDEPRFFSLWETGSVSHKMVSRLLIIDDHEVFRQGLKAVLESAGKLTPSPQPLGVVDPTEKNGSPLSGVRPSAELGVLPKSGEDLHHSIEVAKTVASGEEALTYLESNTVDLVLLDVRFTGEDGLVTLRKIHEQHRVKVIVLSAYDNPTYIARAATLGASDYITKCGSMDELLKVVDLVLRGKGPCQDGKLSKIQRIMKEELRPSDLPESLPLTGREGQVLRHIALGLSNKEIGLSLMISVETVKEHVQSILRKINANDRTDAAVRAVRAGLID